MRMAAFTLLLALVQTCAAYGQTRGDADTKSEDVKSKIVALERLSKAQACKAKDIKTLDAILDDRFLFVDIYGRLQTKADLLHSVQAAESLQYTVDAMDVRLHQDTAVVTGLYQVKAVMHGTLFQQRGRFVDTWQLKGGNWFVIASLSVPAE